MNNNQKTKLSKTLSYVLRHRPDTIGITLDEKGWVSVTALITALNQHGKSLTRDMLDEIVSTNSKKRFEFDATGTQLRARQGHSVAIDLGYEPQTPPDILYHGTATRFLDSIRAKGLIKSGRHHVHLSIDKTLMKEVGRRHGEPVLIQIDAQQMHQAGHLFFQTENAVWLTDHVPAEYLQVID